MWLELIHFKKGEFLMNSKQQSYETRIRIPAGLGASLIALVGGSDIYSLKDGILKACELAADSQPFNGTGHGRSGI
jgi:hypothetical protein